MGRSRPELTASIGSVQIGKLRILGRDFYDRPPSSVARELLGKFLVATSPLGTCLGRIVESEAYLASGDSACHAARGPRPKNASMFGPPGHAYVYAIHARWCFNVVTEPSGVASAVLVRAIEPLGGTTVMSQRRGTEKLLDLARGPARLCQALNIDRAFDGWDLTRGEQLWLAHDPDSKLADESVGQSPRIGVTSAQEMRLRFFVRASPFVSGTTKGQS